MTRSFKILLIAIGVIVGITALAVATEYWKRKRTQRATTATYTYEMVTRRDIERAVLTTGTLTPMTTVEISSQISGLVESVYVDFNSAVKQGDTLARIESASYLQRLRQAEADLAAAEASHRMLATDADRHQKLLKADLATQQEYDRASALLQQAAATLLTRRAAVENARLDLERCTIVSPIDGMIIYKAVEPGKTIAASFSAPTLFVIAQDLRKMRMLAPVTEVDISAIRVGQEVTFRVDAIKNRTFKGTLVQIRNPYTPTDASTRLQSTPAAGITSFDCVIEVSNTDLHLRPGFNAVVSIIVEKVTNALCVPNSALRIKRLSHRGPSTSGATETDNVSTIYVIPEGNNTNSPQPVRVTTGITDGVVTEVTGEVSAGDKVVVAMHTQ